MKIGRKLFFDTATKNIILDTGEKQGSVIPTTIEQDILTFKALSERNRETFDVLELPFGAYASDFQSSTGYRVVDVDETFTDVTCYTKDNQVFQVGNIKYSFGVEDIEVKVDGEIVTEGFTFDKGIITFDEPQVKEFNGKQVQKFVTVSGRKVKHLEFSYPDPNEPEAEPEYIPPLSEQVMDNMEYLVDIDYRLLMVEYGLV